MLYVLVEGNTEDRFVKTLLGPHLHERGVWAVPIEVTTKKNPLTGEKLARGGGQWKHWRRDILSVLAGKPAGDRVTSMFDLYGLPKDFPALDAGKAERDTVKRAQMLEKAMAAEIGDRRFIPYIQRHEFEALVLAGIDHLAEILIDPAWKAGIAALRAELGTTRPEDVNDGKETAPSKRLLAHVPGYNKTTHGPLVTSKVGVEGLKQRCPRFGAWLAKLEALGEKGS